MPIESRPKLIPVAANPGPTLGERLVREMLAFSNESRSGPKVVSVLVDPQPPPKPVREDGDRLLAQFIALSREDTQTASAYGASNNLGKQFLASLTIQQLDALIRAFNERMDEPVPALSHKHQALWDAAVGRSH